MGMPSPVIREKKDNMMRWPETARLPRKVREMRERVDHVLRGMNRGVGEWDSGTGFSRGVEFRGKRDEMVLEFLPFWGVIGLVEGKFRRDLKEICRFPLWGRAKEDRNDGDMDGDGDFVGIESVTRKDEMNWLAEDDIEDIED